MEGARDFKLELEYEGCKNVLHLGIRAIWSFEARRLNILIRQHLLFLGYLFYIEYLLCVSDTCKQKRLKLYPLSLHYARDRKITK